MPPRKTVGRELRDSRIGAIRVVLVTLILVAPLTIPSEGRAQEPNEQGWTLKKSGTSITSRSGASSSRYHGQRPFTARRPRSRS